MYLGIAILGWAILPGYFCYEDIHRYMTLEEVRQVFHTEADSVPEYEIVKLRVPERLHKRDLPSGSYFHMKAFGQNINLWLHPRDSLLAGIDTPVYYAKSSQNAPQGVKFRHQPGLMGMVGRIYEDPNKMASFVIGTEDTGRTRVNGYIGTAKMAIRALPQRVADEYSRRRRSVDDMDDAHSLYHVVIKMNEKLDTTYSHPPVNGTKLQERLSRSVTPVPDTLYPEVLVVVENSVYASFQTPHGHDIYGLLEYLLAFWNGVDLKYRSLETPRFRFHISAIVLAEDAEATPYIGKNMISATGFNITTAMPLSKKFYYGVKDTFDLDSYDIAATMTRHSFGNTAVLGQAWVGAACQRSDYVQTIDAVSIYIDDGVFSGIHYIAHELGHIFGADHDPASADCAYSKGYLMAPVPWFSINSADFSPCSREAFQKRLNDQKLTCLYNRPNENGESLPKIMPGRMKNLDTQCKKLAGGASCQNEHPEYSVCVTMFCLNENGTCEATGIAALDGTKCGGKNEFCLHQQCVSL